MADAADTSTPINNLPAENPKIESIGKREVATVKWFSARKCFGFLGDPENESSDVFVHQSQLHCPPGSYRTLKPGMQVEYTKAKDADSGRETANDVTAVGGGWIVLPPRPKKKEDEDGDAKNGRHRNPRNRRGKAPPAEEGGDEKHDEDHDAEEDVPADGTKKDGSKRTNRRRNKKPASDEPKVDAAPDKEPTRPRKEHWHETLEESVKEHLKELGIPVKGTTVDVLVTMANDQGAARIKIGSDGYTTCVHQKGFVTEGSYVFTPAGLVTCEWKRGLQFVDSEWKASTEPGQWPIPHQVDLNASDLAPVKSDDEVAAAFGGGLPPPLAQVLEEAGFSMRNVIHDPAKARGRGGGGGGRGGRRYPNKRKSNPKPNGGA